MKVAEFADSDALKSAEPVFAVGTPDNRGGVVSLGRVLVPKLEGRLEYNGFGFADAIKMRIDVVPGNSGGPVFDRAGKLVGIIGAFGLPDPGEKTSRLGYAVPSNSIRAYLARR
jgi:S1-C subfamily serine protease